MTIVAAALMLVGANGPAMSDDSLLRGYVTCLAKRDAAKLQLLLTTKNDSDYRAAATDLAAEPRCGKGADLGAGMFLTAFSQDSGQLRGIAAEALLQRSRNAARLPAMPKLKAYAAGWFIMSGRARAVDEMAMCVAATNPAGIVALLASRPGSVGQNDAFTALAPALGQCLSVGYQLNTKPSGLRAALAEALYQRNQDAVATGAGSST